MDTAIRLEGLAAVELWDHIIFAIAAHVLLNILLYVAFEHVRRHKHTRAANDQLNDGHQHQKRRCMCADLEACVAQQHRGAEHGKDWR